MRAVVVDEFGQVPKIRVVDDPACAPTGVVIEVAATGLCRSDWHGWLGHDDDITLPHVPGHELAGTIAEVGKTVANWRVGDRVTTPFVCACGVCPTCLRGDHQVCDAQFQPGFTHWGSFANLVAIDRADVNLVAVPDAMDIDTAASLGCRFSTAYRAVVEVAQVTPGDWVAVHGCGGIGLSAVMIASAHGAHVIAVDVARASLDLALMVGALHTVDAASTDVANAIVELTGGGAAVSVDALGSRAIVDNSLRSLRKRGRHVQVGLLAGNDATPSVAMERVIAAELQILGSHGMAAHSYPRMMAEIAAGTLRPEQLIRDRIGLDETPARLVALGEHGAGAGGITIINP